MRNGQNLVIVRYFPEEMAFGTHRIRGIESNITIQHGNGPVVTRFELDINYRRFNEIRFGSSGQRVHGITYLMAHELGHAVGLEDLRNRNIAPFPSGTVMFVALVDGDIMNPRYIVNAPPGPTAFDRANLRSIYGN